MHSRPRQPPGEPADGMPAVPERGSRLGRWLDRRLGNPPSEVSLVDTMSRALDTMQAQIARVQLALDPPELVIEIPRDICQFYEFWRAKEVVRIGREVAEKALDKRSEEHTSELQSLMRITYAVFCLKTKNQKPTF